MAKMSLDQAPSWVRRLDGEMRAAALRGVRSAGQRLVGHIVADVIPSEPRQPVDRGLYRAAWRSRSTPDGCVVENDSPHALFIEDGVRGENVKVGRKLIDALAEWASRKGLVRDVPKAGRASAARGIAFAIANGMKRTGIFGMGRGLKILEKARRRVTEFIESEVTAELRKMRL